MKQFVVLLLFLLGFVAPFADAKQDAYGPDGAGTTLPKRGTLYRVLHDGNVAYLFGTIHVGRAGFYPLEEQVTRALSESSTLVLEVDLRNTEAVQQAIGRYGIYSDGSTLAQHVGPDVLAQLRRVLKRYQLPYEQVAHMKPWFVVNMLFMLELQRNGYETRYAAESYLLSSARPEARVVGLETIDYQLSLFESMSAAGQERYLQENLTELENGKGMRKARDMLDGWGRADSRAFDDLMREIQRDKSVTAQFVRKVMVEKRNLEMADKLDGLLKDGQRSFVGVGLLHLIGDRGLPQLLRQRGYLVEKLY